MARVRAVVTDLDGTLLDPGGLLSPEAAKALGRLKELGVVTVPLTSKTEDELRSFLVETGAGSVGAFENGAGIVEGGRVTLSPKAVPHRALRARLKALSLMVGVPLLPIEALPEALLARITGLPAWRLPAMAARRFDVPFLVPEGEEGPLAGGIASLAPDLRVCRGGLFWHLSGNHGKEDSLELLLSRGVVARPLAGFGDAPADAAFLARCDVAVLVPGPAGTVDPELRASLPEGRVARFAAGRGWADSVLDLLAEER